MSDLRLTNVIADTGLARRRVLIVDAHRSFTDALSLALERYPNLLCVGSCHSLDELGPAIARSSPDVIIMDTHVGRSDGIRATASLKRTTPQIDVVILSADSSLTAIERAAECGAIAFVSKEEPMSAIMQAVAHPSDGFVVSPHAIHAARRAQLEPTAGERDRVPQLFTTRERQVLHLLAEGRDASTIANGLGISLGTCRSHIKSILRKLNAHSQLQAVTKARRLGHIPT